MIDLEVKSRDETFDEVLSSFSERKRRIIMAREVEQLTYKQISLELGMTVPAVREQYKSARNAILRAEYARQRRRDKLAQSLNPRTAIATAMRTKNYSETYTLMRQIYRDYLQKRPPHETELSFEQFLCACISETHELLRLTEADTSQLILEAFRRANR